MPYTLPLSTLLQKLRASSGVLYGKATSSCQRQNELDHKITRHIMYHYMFFRPGRLVSTLSGLYWSGLSTTTPHRTCLVLPRFVQLSREALDSTYHHLVMVVCTVEGRWSWHSRLVALCSSSGRRHEP
ncbi:hypothetical protein PILCRDRAFT_261245 [Piloderma croceum F 1598]|uniref:Uncharacterized protein n=1 Tax=Piloderma croceum (strain F 1598) TaxID=765440 RepID=A0A0C3BMS8_PILCF|nr:hypothetical protein PILCRDRAFT_261245 [Piloderma croceum F 1598]